MADAAAYDCSQDMATLARIAKEPSRKFRSFLRFLVKGYHFNQAWQLVSMRAAAKCEIVAEDINQFLSMCAFGTESHMVEHLLAEWKREKLLDKLSEAEMVTQAAECLQRFDIGDAKNLESIAYQRSQQIHEDKKSGKRARPEESAAAEAAADVDASTGSKRPRLTDAECSAKWAAEGALYKKYSEVLKTKFAEPPGQYQRPRLERAKQIFAGFEPVANVKPNARSFVLMLATAMASNDIDYAKEVAKHMLSSCVDASSLYMHMQPAFLHKLVEHGVLENRADLLEAAEATEKWCFLTAASEASKGDQFGSKHGAVLLKDGKYLSKGHNHRFGIPGDSHLRVMHAEIHALCKLPDISHAVGSEVYIVELDGHGVGYEEAVPCPMCQAGLCKTGVCKAHFSSHKGIISQPVSHRPHLQCQTLEFASKRIYPEPLVHPDAP